MRGNCLTQPTGGKVKNDEYFVVLQGCYTLIIDGKRIPVRAGEEYFIPKGTWHGGAPVAGTRTIHAFGSQRAVRVQPRGLPDVGLTHYRLVGQFDVEAAYAATWRGKLAAAGAN